MTGVSVYAMSLQSCYYGYRQYRRWQHTTKGHGLLFARLLPDVAHYRAFGFGRNKISLSHA